MQTRLELSPKIKEPYAVIHAREMTGEVQRAFTLLQSQEAIVTAEERGKTFVVGTDEIFMICVENGKSMLHVRGKQLVSPKRLYELETLLGGGFMRISKTTLVNLKQLDSVESSFKGTMYLRLKNGEGDYISRTYLPAFKQYLGL